MEDGDEPHPYWVLQVDEGPPYWVLQEDEDKPHSYTRFHSQMHLSFNAERYISSSKISHFLKNKCAIGECFVNGC